MWPDRQMPWLCSACFLISCLVSHGPGVAAAEPANPTGAPAKHDARAAYSRDWTALFDGKTLGRWAVSDFGGEPEEVRVEQGMIRLDFGAAMLSGVTWTGALPLLDYELALEAQRVAGSDFFCGLTFPVGNTCCSLIVGGWGGSLVGLSSLDGLDASQNETQTMRTFENGRWYRIRVRIEKARIQAWIDDKRVVDADTTGRRIGIRMEVEPSQPLGIAAWQTQAAVRNIRLRLLD